MIGEKLPCQIDLTGAAVGVWNVVATNPDSETFTLSKGFIVVGTLWSENFDGSVSGWTSQATTGSNSWSLVTTPGQSPAKSYFAPGPSTKTTANLTSPTFPVSARASKLQLRIWHSYNLQSTRDAGKLELSTNNGSTWIDVESTGSGAPSPATDTTPRSAPAAPTPPATSSRSRAWSGTSSGPVETIVNLNTAKYAGKNLRFRWCWPPMAAPPAPAGTWTASSYWATCPTSRPPSPPPPIRLPPKPSPTAAPCRSSAAPQPTWP